MNKQGLGSSITFFAATAMVLAVSGGCARYALPARSTQAARVSGELTPDKSATARDFIDAPDPEYSLAGLYRQNQDLAAGVRRPDTVVLISYFSGDRMNCIAHSFVLRDGLKGDVRFVKDWAIQGSLPGGVQSTHPMPAAQRSALDEAIGHLSPGRELARDSDAFVVSWEDARGRWRTRTYDAKNLPPAVLALRDLAIDGVPSYR